MAQQYKIHPGKSGQVTKLVMQRLAMHMHDGRGRTPSIQLCRAMRQNTDHRDCASRHAGRAHAIATFVMYHAHQRGRCSRSRNGREFCEVKARQLKRTIQKVSNCNSDRGYTFDAYLYPTAIYVSESN